MKLASIILTFWRPVSFRRHKANNSRDSGAAATQYDGGWSHLSQSLHVSSIASLGIPCDISIVSLTQSLQRAPAAVVPSIGTPQLQHSILFGVSLEHPKIENVRRVLTLPLFVG